jgi:hypothetical protein
MMVAKSLQAKLKTRQQEITCRVHVYGECTRGCAKHVDKVGAFRVVRVIWVITLGLLELLRVIMVVARTTLPRLERWISGMVLSSSSF